MWGENFVSLDEALEAENMVCFCRRYPSGRPALPEQPYAVAGIDGRPAPMWSLIGRRPVLPARKPAEKKAR